MRFVSVRLVMSCSPPIMLAIKDLYIDAAYFNHVGY